MTPRPTARSGLASNGRKNRVPSVAKFTCVPAAVRPAPTSPPTKPCVVEPGNPVKVANITVNPAPNPTANTNCGDTANVSGTNPLAEKFWSRLSARNNEVIDPANIEIVAQLIAALLLVVPLPKSVATPLKLSFAPFE